MFRRRRASGSSERPAVPVPGTEEPERDELPRPQGPWDVDDVQIDLDASDVIDLGGLVITARSGLELRLQVDERTETVTAAMLVSADGALELRAFAAPRNESIWDDVRRGITAEATQRGGTATEQSGPFGPELKLAVPVKTKEGKQATQVSRIVGVAAPRWLLRGTFLGKPASEPDPDGLLESAFRDVVVRRGDAPMAPRSAIPLHMPKGAEPPQEPESGDPPSPG